MQSKICRAVLVNLAKFVGTLYNICNNKKSVELINNFVICFDNNL